jgi:positive regulator of sigma E activity
MLPAMFIAIIGLLFSMVKYSKVTNMLVHQVHMDPTGTELTFIYKNAFFRRFRNDKPEQSILISQLVDPPQGDDYVPL